MFVGASVPPLLLNGVPAWAIGCGLWCGVEDTQIVVLGDFSIHAKATNDKMA